MVWSQYVYEATNGFDPDASDDDEFFDDTPLNIEDWEVQYSDELWHMWNIIRTSLYDSHIMHDGKFCDFVEFCFREHETCSERVTWDDDVYGECLHTAWRRIRQSVNANGLHEEMMRGASFLHFEEFAKYYMELY
jgi:hypothetical protein